VSDAATALIRAISDKFDKLSRFTLEEIRSRDWASATFEGMRHELSFSVAGPGAEAEARAFLGGLEETEFALHGHFVADIACVSQSLESGPEGPLVRIGLEALTIEEA
jgi:hypothetical protein